MGWSGVNFLLLLFSAVRHFPDFWFFDPLKFNFFCDPLWWGGGKKIVIDFLNSSLNLPDFWNLDLQPPPLEPPQGGMGKNKLYWFSGQFMTFPGLLIFWPPKIPTSTPPPWVGRSIFLGRNHPQICRDLCILNPFSDLFLVFKVTISRHFAGYASVALETIWLHEPRDLIFLGPPMTLLCLSRYSRCTVRVPPATGYHVNSCLTDTH